MNAVRCIACLLVLCGISMAQSWTLYYSETGTVNGDGSVTLTPTVGITGDDGGYCDPFAGYTGFETPSVMLNGSAWVLGDTIGSGGMYNGGSSLDFSYTFPDVTIPVDGSAVNLSYAGKVQGTCFLTTFPVSSAPPYTTSAFYMSPFVDGTAPPISPAPCWILMGFSPQCERTWPPLWLSIPVHAVTHDLNSQKVAQNRFYIKTYEQGLRTCGVIDDTECTRVTHTCDTFWSPPYYNPVEVVTNAGGPWLLLWACTRPSPSFPWGCTPEIAGTDPGGTAYSKPDFAFSLMFSGPHHCTTELP